MLASVLVLCGIFLFWWLFCLDFDHTINAY